MMFGECGTSRNKTVHHYYKCANAKRTKTCKKKTVRKEWLEDLVIAETMKLIQDDAVIDAIVAEVMELQDQENTTIPLLEKQMREVENSIENMLNAIQAGVLTSSTKARLEKLEAQQKELEVRIAEEKIAKPRLSENQIRFWLTRLRKLDTRVKSHRETLINTFVNAVYLYDEKVLITFNYKDGTKTITFDEIAAKDAPEGNGSDLGCFAPPRTPVSNGYRSFYFVCLKKGMQGWIRTAAEPTAACGGNREARLGQRSAFSKPCQGAAEKAASATRKTRRIVRRVKKPLCNSDDRCQRQKQGGIVGAAASRMRVPPKARCSRWEPRPGLLFCAARVIHPRPPKNRNVSQYAAVLFYSSVFASPACQSSWARMLF